VKHINNLTQPKPIMAEKGVPLKEKPAKVKKVR